MNKALTPVVIIIIAIALFFWQIKPLYTNITELRAQAADYDKALEIAEQVQDLQTKLAEKYQSIDPAALQRIETFLPSHLDTVRLILDLNAIAATYNITLRDIKTAEVNQVGGGANQKAYNTGTISFGFTSPYLDIVDFMRDVEASLRLIDVQSISIKPSGTSGRGGYDVDVTLNTYWLNRK